MRKTNIHKWVFVSRFRTNAYGWRASKLACKRIKEAVSEIKKVTRKDPVLGAEGSIKFMEKLWTLFFHLPISIQYCIFRCKCSGSKELKAFFNCYKLRNRKMRSSLKHHQTLRKDSNCLEYLIPCNWMLSCKQNLDGICFIDLPQGGEPEK